MTSISSLTREQKIYLALWRKAFKDNASVEVNLRTYNEALSMRMAMYRTIRPYRDEELVDEELRLASERFVISVLKDSKTLVIKPRGTLSAAEQAMADLGITEEDLLSPEERLLYSNMEREIDELIQPVEDLGKKSNPFYTR